MTHDAEARSKHSPADQEFLDGVSARQLMDFRDHDLGGGGRRAKVRFAPGEDLIECRRTCSTCNGAHACETLDPALRTIVHFELNPASRDAIIAAQQETRRREGNSPEERVAVFMKIICDAKCLAVDSMRSRAPTERKRVADEDISARPPKRRAHSIFFPSQLDGTHLLVDYLCAVFVRMPGTFPADVSGLNLCAVDSVELRVLSIPPLNWYEPHAERLKIYWILEEAVRMKMGEAVAPYIRKTHGSIIAELSESE
ncbi:hypothetical protein B0H13DRAFT_1909782 [Mycena leptocephala]|nr:hypothetical protein B0H13DRAFT_1909782 [Mycena leptocephala]